MSIPKLTLLLLAFYALFIPQSETFAKVQIYTNATIYTVNPKQAVVSAFATQDGKFIAVGEATSLLKRFEHADIIDLQNATVVPGFIDAHGHLLGLGQSLHRVDLTNTASVKDIQKALQQFSSTLTKNQWLLGRGWDQNDWPDATYPTAQDLDSLFPERPVWLRRIDGHAGWANSAAMRLIEKDLSGDWQIEGGEIIRDEHKNATGIFVDNAMSLIESRIPKASDTDIQRALQTAMQKTASVGLTSVHDAGTSLAVWQSLNALPEKDINTRVYAMADGNAEMLDFLCQQGVQNSPSNLLTARAIKLYSDGALGSRGAALLEEYSDDKGNTGLLIEPESSLTKTAKKAAKCGLQVNIHAIGDRGNRVALNALTAIQSSQNPGRHRIEHAQVLHPDDFARYAQLNLIASVQPTHATSDMGWAEKRVGQQRIKSAYAWQTFLQHNIPLALGSDFPIEKPDPILGFYAAVSRQNEASQPENGWYPHQKLSREQALYGFTLGAAHAGFQDDHIGSIEVGKWADFTVLSQNIITIETDKIPSTEILATYLNGKPIYTKNTQ